MNRPMADEALLFGVLAYQLNFITRDALTAAVREWEADRSRTLAQILKDRGWLDGERRALLEGLAEEHRRKHGGDLRQSLAALSAFDSVRNDLQQLGGSEVQATLATLNLLASAEPAAPGAPSAPPSPTATLATQGQFAGSAAGSASPAAPSEATPVSGRRFRVLRSHARGGLGEVFVAQDEELNRLVALKQIQDRYAGDAEGRARFLLEAEVTGQLEHPGIVPVYGLGTYADGRPYYAMRFIQGDSLQEAITRFHGPNGPRDPGRRALEFRGLLKRFIDVCNAVEYAHSKGVLHRDLKPGNIMLGPYGETLVVDWGLAKSLGRKEPGANRAGGSAAASQASGSAATQMGSVVGTPAYMSPEQAAGRIDELGPASDVYSLGATMYALLTGRPPLERLDVATTLARVQRGEFPPPRQVDRSVPPALEAVCLKAMAVKPDDRYAAPRALADDLEHWLADEPVAAHRDSWGARLGRWTRRHKGLVRGGAAAGLAILATVAAAMVMIIQSRDEAVRLKDQAQEERDRALRAEQVAVEARQEEEKQRTLALAAHQQTEKALRETSTALYLHRFAQVEREWTFGNFSRALELLESCSPEQRNWEWHYLNRLDGLRLILKDEGRNFTGVAFSPDGKHVATSCAGKVMIWDADTGKESTTLESFNLDDYVFSVAYSSDGKRIAAGLWDKTVRVWDSTTGKPLCVLQKHTDKVFNVAFSPDSRRLASASGDGTVVVWDVAAGKEVLALEGRGDFVNGVAWSPDGKLIASAGGPKTLKIWDADTGKEKLTLEGHTAPVLGVAFSPDGARLVSSGRDQTVRLWDIPSGREVRIFRGHLNSIPAVAFSPDGRRIASAGYDRTVRIWDVNDSERVRVLRGHTNTVTTVAFSPDGRRLGTGSWDGTGMIWDATPDLGGRFVGHRSQVTGVAFSPNSRLVASSGADNAVKVWNLSTGQAVHSFDGDNRDLNSVSFSPDGKRLACGSDHHAIMVWDVSSGQRVFTLKGHARLVRSAVFSPDGNQIASASDDETVKLWDAGTGRLLLTLPGHTSAVASIAFSPDGGRLVSGSSDRTARVWDTTTGRLLHNLKGHADRIMSVAYSPDGRRIASGGADGTVKVWDATSGREVRSMQPGEGGSVSCVAFSVDGSRLAGGTDDGKVKLWETSTGQQLLALLGHKGTVRCVAFSPDGNLLASGGEDTTVRIWDGTPRP